MSNVSNTKIRFTYKGFDKNKAEISGEIFAQNKQLALLMLKKKGLVDIKLSKYAAPSILSTIFSSNRILSSDVTLFTRQVATMQNAGIPLIQGINIIRDGATKEVLRYLLGQISEDLENGLSLSESLKKHPMIFDDLFCNLIASGERAGTLDIMLERIALYKEKTESTKRKIKKAMFYPLTVLVIAGIVTAILLIKVVPTFKTMFDSFGAKLPTFTLFVLGLSDFISHNALLIGAMLTATIFTVRNLYKTNVKFRNNIQRQALKLPIFGNILHKAALARFTRTLSTTFAAGVPLTIALDSVAQSSGNIVYQNAIMRVKDKVSDGQQLNKALAEHKIFPTLVVQMISIGEESGSLETMLAKSAAIYEEEVDALVDGLSSMLEPLIMVVLGVIVGGLVIAMYLPIFKLGSVI
jgi:type IV pilus assembly protein PilC